MPDSVHSSRSVSSTLLLRLRQQEPEAWERLLKLFGPTVYSWCRRAGLEAADAADVTQEVFRSVILGMDKFRRDRPQDTFRGWLSTIARNRIRDHFRRQAKGPQGGGGTDFQLRVANLPAPQDECSYDATSPSGLEARAVLHRALELVQAEFETRTWRAFWRTAVEQAAPSAVALDLGVSLNAVYKAKSRVLRRLREELDGLIV